MFVYDLRCSFFGREPSPIFSASSSLGTAKLLFLLRSEQTPLPEPLPLSLMLQPPAILWALRWINSGLPTAFMHRETPDWIHSARCGLVSAEWKGIINFLDLPPVLHLIGSHISPFAAARVCTDSVQPTPRPPVCFSRAAANPVVPRPTQGASPSKMEGAAFVPTAFQEGPAGPVL